MNWTGGELTRAAPTKGKALLQKQKAHFAKARAAASSRTATAAHHATLSALSQRSIAKLDPSSDDKLQRGSRFEHMQDLGQYHTPSERMSSKRMRAQKRHHSNSPSHVAHPHSREQWLVSKREELLKRSDWLALRVTKPLRLTFPARRDKDQIGRRRKIRESDVQKSTIIRRTLFSPLMEERLSRPGRFREPSWLQEDNLRIKFGTDALLSQTQRSRLSHTNVDRHVEQQSPGLDALSEEPMLLDTDDEMYEEHAHTTMKSTSGTRQNTPDDTRQAFAAQEDARRTPLHQAPVAANMQAPRSAIVPHEDQSGPRLESFLPRSCAPLDCSTTNWTRQSLASTRAFPRGGQIDQKKEDEKCWKELMGINTTNTADACAKAQDMLGYTCSGMSLERIAETVSSGGHTNTMLISTPQGTDTPDTMLPIRSFAPASFYEGNVRPESQSRQEDTVQETSSDEDHSWRQFIIGNRSSHSSDLFPDPIERESVLRNSSPITASVSGLGSSIRATKYSTTLGHTTSSIPGHTSTFDPL